MKFEVKVPAVGESITEATIGEWPKASGQSVKRNDVILLLETDKASVEVVAEHDGVLTIKAEKGQTIPIGSVVAIIDTEAVQATIAPQGPASPQGPVSPQIPAIPQVPASAQPSVVQQGLSPAVRKIVAEKGLDASQVAGSGRGGRITKEDAMSATAAGTAMSSMPMAPTVTSPTNSVSAPAVRNPVNVGTQKRVAMTTIRKRIAERLVMSQQTTATLTTFNEIDMTRVMELRAKHKDKFKEKYGVGLGFMGFFVKACIEALKSVPAVNAFIDGTDLIYNEHFNIGVAVGTEKGLIVPVIKDSGTMSIAQVEMTIRDFALKARDGKISLDDLNGGTFTISNGGVYGSLMSTPILNPPQSGILGMHKIEERAVVMNGKVEVRSMMYVALSYDHRVIDGKEAVTFLVKIKEGIEDPERLLLEI